MNDPTRDAGGALPPRTVERVRAALSHLRTVHRLDHRRIAELAGELPECVAACEGGYLTPMRELQFKIKALSLRMAFASTEAWKRRVGASSGHEMLLDRNLAIISVSTASSSLRCERIPPELLLGRSFNEILPTLDASLIETHGNGIDDLKTNGFFDGTLACVRFSAEIDAPPFVRAGIFEYRPVDTIDQGILVHHVLHRLDKVERPQSGPGIHVHWRETVRA